MAAHPGARAHPRTALGPRDGDGVSELITAAPHVVAPAFAAEQIGFPVGNPFQWEVVWATICFTVLGLLCLRFRTTDYWFATITGYLVYVWGCGIGHVREYVLDDNTAPDNWGRIVPVAFLMPLVLMVLVLLLRAEQRRGPGVHEQSRESVAA